MDASIQGVYESNEQIEILSLNYIRGITPQHLRGLKLGNTASNSAETVVRR